MIVSGQVTIPTGGGPVQLSTVGTLVRCIAFQNNAAGAISVGGSTVSATVGYILSATGGALVVGGGEAYFSSLSDWYAFGTAAQVLNFLYVT